MNQDHDQESTSSSPPLESSFIQLQQQQQQQQQLEQQFGPRFKVLKVSNPIRELQTIIRDKNTNRCDFIFCADRLIRLIVEEGLNQLPYEEEDIRTPTGASFTGLKFLKGNCGVSIVRSGESMEQGLRDCCRSIRIGKILVQKDDDNSRARVVYAKFPLDIHERKVLLMYPIMSSGMTVVKAVKVLKENRVLDQNIILLNLFCTFKAAEFVVSNFPLITVLTTEVHSIAPNHFGQKYFGTD